MALKDKWKNAGKSIGGAFSNFGKAMGTTMKVAFTDEKNEVEENGHTKLANAWRNTGKGFGKAGKSLGKAAQGTAQKVIGKEQEEQPKEKDVVEVVDVSEK